jgi:dipeptidyl aminopeptidase/acylaminoacyl peptidase
VKALIVVSAVSVLMLLFGAVPAVGETARVIEISLGGEVRVLGEGRRGVEALRVLPSGAGVLWLRPAADGSRVGYRVEPSGRRTRLPITGDGRGSFSPDGSRVFAETGPVEIGRVVLRTIAGRRLRSLLPAVADLPMSGTWSRTGQRLVVVDQTDRQRRRFRLRLLNARTGTVVTSRRVLGQPVAGDEAFSSTGDDVALGLRETASVGLRAVVVSLRTGQRVDLGRTTHAAPAMAPDGRRVAVATTDGFIDIVDATSGALQQRVALPDVLAGELTWSPDGSRVAYITLQPELFACPSRCTVDDVASGLAIADLRDGHVDTLLAGKGRVVTQPGWRPDGQALFASCRTVAAVGC